MNVIKRYTSGDSWSQIIICGECKATLEVFEGDVSVFDAAWPDDNGFRPGYRCHCVVCGCANRVDPPAKIAEEKVTRHRSGMKK